MVYMSVRNILLPVWSFSNRCNTVFLLSSISILVLESVWELQQMPWMQQKKIIWVEIIIMSMENSERSTLCKCSHIFGWHRWRFHPRSSFSFLYVTCSYFLFSIIFSLPPWIPHVLIQCSCPSLLLFHSLPSLQRFLLFPCLLSSREDKVSSAMHPTRAQQKVGCVSGPSSRDSRERCKTNF